MVIIVVKLKRHLRRGQLSMRKWELEHSNQLHQLLVSVSRHLYVRKNGILKYQEKPLDIDLPALGKSRREHLVYYIMRDALSGTFFLEIARQRALQRDAGAGPRA